MYKKLQKLWNGQRLVGERKEKATSRKLKRSGLPLLVARLRDVYGVEEANVQEAGDWESQAETNVGGKTVTNYSSSQFLLDSAVLTAGRAEPFLYNSS